MLFILQAAAEKIFMEF